MWPHVHSVSPASLSPLSLPSPLIAHFLLGSPWLPGVCFCLEAPLLSLSTLAIVGTIVHLDGVPSLVLLFFVCCFFQILSHAEEILDVGFGGTGLLSLFLFEKQGNVLMLQHILS